jgi:ABC-type transporter Mla subunit MlaD
MERHIHIHHHFPAGAELLGLLTSFLGELKSIKKELTHMSAEIDRLTASVAALTTAEQSSNALLAQLSQLIRDNANDPAALNALADSIDADTAEITAAVVANTPAAPAA